MRRDDAKVYSIMDGHRLNTLIKAEIQSWVIDTRLRAGTEMLLSLLKTIPYNSHYGLTVAAIVADLKVAWRAHDKNPEHKSWDCYDEGAIVSRAISENKAVRKRLGSGAFGSAFLMKDDRVLKINTGKSSYDSWYSWARECHKNGGANPLMPRIYELNNYGSTYAAFMEKLEGWTRAKMKSDTFCHLEGYIMENPKFIHDKLMTEAVMEPNATFDHVVEVSEAIKGIVQSVFKSRIDIHSDNAMFRGKQLVITDPLAYGVVPDFMEPFYEAPKPKPVVIKDLEYKAQRNKEYGKVGGVVGQALNDLRRMNLQHQWDHWWIPERPQKIEWFVGADRPAPELPVIKVKDNGERFGLAFDKIENKKNFRLTLPDPWFRQQEKAHNSLYNKLLEGLKFDDFFAKGEPQSRHQMKILKGRKEVDAQGAQAP